MTAGLHPIESAISIARSYTAQGMYVFPLTVRVGVDGKKRLHFSGSWSQQSTIDQDKIAEWFGAGRSWETESVGIDCGKSGIVVIDTDMTDGIDGVQEWRGLYGFADQTFKVRTPGGGIHFYYQADPSHVVSIDSSGKLGRNVDVRGTGGFVIAAGCTDSRGVYTPNDAIPVPADLPSVPQIVIDRVSRSAIDSGDVPISTHPFDPFSARIFTPAQANDHCRPAFDALANAVEGQVNHCLNVAAKTAYHFVPYVWPDRVHVDSLLMRLQLKPWHDDNDTDARGTLASAWRSSRADWLAVTPEAFGAAHGAVLTPVDHGSGVTVRPDPLGAAGAADDNDPFVDVAALMAAGLPDPPKPTILTRRDGISLFYAGKVSILFGDPESGKSWIAYAAVVEMINAGKRAAIIDVDHNGATDILQRLITLGIDQRKIVEPDRFMLAEPEDGHALLYCVARIAAIEPDLVVIDSIGEVIPMLGKNSSNPDDFSIAHRMIMTPLANAGAATVGIDHMPKADDARQHGQTGTMAKRRVVNGVTMRVTVVETFAPGRGGAASLTIYKDKPGGLRSQCPIVEAGAKQPAGRFVMNPESNGGVTWWITEPLLDDAEPASGTRRTKSDDEKYMTKLARVTEVLTEMNRPMTRNELYTAIRGTRETLLVVVTRAIDSGLLHPIVRDSWTNPGVPRVWLHKEWS